MLLAIDSSTQRVGLALYDGAQVAGEMVWTSQNHHTVELAPAVDELLRRCGVKPDELTCLAVGWYTAQGEDWKSDGEALVTTAEELAARIRKPTLVCGELTADERQLLARKRKNVLLASPAQSVRRPALLAELAWKRFQDGQRDEVISLAPIYLHVAEPIPA